MQVTRKFASRVLEMDCAKCEINGEFGISLLNKQTSALPQGPLSLCFFLENYTKTQQGIADVKNSKFLPSPTIFRNLQTLVCF